MCEDLRLLNFSYENLIKRVAFLLNIGYTERAYKLFAIKVRGGTDTCWS